MRCPDCNIELIDPPVYCRCGHDFRHSDRRSVYLVADRPMKFKERLFAPWKVRKNYRWVDKDGIIRKNRQWLLGVWSILTILGFGSAYLQNPNIFGLQRSGPLYKLFILFIPVSFIMLAINSLKTKAKDKGIESFEDDQEAKKMYDFQYQQWLDTSFAILNGKTPREASKSEEGRIKIEELLKEIESAHKGSYDISWIRKDLDL